MSEHTQMSKCLVALDLETTGLNPKTDRILEIGAVKLTDGKVTDTYSVFVNSGKHVSEFITGLTGITDEMIQSGLPVKEAIEGFLAFCGDADILGHNILFDYSFLKRNAVNLGYSFEKNGIDTLKIAQKFLSELPSRSLGALCAHYQIIQEKQHRAFEDAVSAYRLYECMKEEFENVSPAAFLPKQLIYEIKKEGPITISQKRYLNDLLKYHRIELDVAIESMTKNEASRTIDIILSQYGKIKR